MTTSKNVETIHTEMPLRPDEALIAHGGWNPRKVLATAAVAARYIDLVMVQPTDAAPGVPLQPWGRLQTMLGARNRSAGAHSRLPRAGLSVGIESGAVEVDGRLATVAAVWAVRHDGRRGVAFTDTVVLPDDIAVDVYGGMEVRDAVERHRGVGSVVDGDCITPLTDGASDTHTFFISGLSRAFEQLYDGPTR